jgi:O-antigen ligase
MSLRERIAGELTWPVAIWTLILGAALGLAAAALAGMETRWVLYGCAGLFLIALFLALPHKEALLFCAFFLSLQIDVYLRPFYGAGGSGGLQFALVSLVGVAYALWCLSTWPAARRRTLIFAGSLRWPIVVMLATTLISSLATSEHFHAMERLLFELQLFLIYWVTLNVVQSEQNVRRVLVLMFITLAVQSMIYFIESGLGVNFTLTGETLALGETPRPGGTVSTNPAGYTSFVMPALLVASAFFMMRQDAWKPRALPLLVLAGAASVGLSFTRAAWIGVAMGILLICFLAAARGKLRVGRATAIAGAIAAVMIALTPMLLSRLQHDYATQTTVDERMNLVLIALNVIRANPLVGVGPGVYDDVFKSFVPEGLGGTWLYTVHNEFLLRMAETGVVGGLAFMWLVVVAWRSAMQVRRSQSQLLAVVATGWLGALTALVWQMNWVPWRGFSYNAMFWLFLGLMDACLRMTGEPGNAAQANRADVAH